MTPVYSVIVVTWNNLQYTARCVDALLRTLPSDAEVIFVDNGSEDGTAAYLADVARRLGDAAKTVFLDENLGLAGGANRGLEIAAGDYLVLLDNDVVVTPRWLEGLRECMEEAPRAVPGARRVGLVGPVTNSARGPQKVQNPPPFHPDALNEHAAEHREAFRRRWAPSFVLATFCLMIRREVVAEIGGLDERFFPLGHEGADLVLRAQERGFECMIASDVYVHHEGSATLNKAFPGARGGAGSADLFFEKWRARRAGRTRLVAAYRVRDAEATLRESLDATARFADAIVVLDDGSTDGTAAIARSHPAVARYERTELPSGVDDRRDRDRALQMAAELAPDWILAVDADEVFEMDRARAERLMQLADPHIKALGFHWYTFWEPTRTYFRADGALGAMSGYRMYRHEPGLRVARGAEGGLPGGGIPEMPDGCGRFTDVRVRRIGWETEASRQARLALRGRPGPSTPPRAGAPPELADLASNTVTLRRYAPASGVSLCIIARNEAERLERFLAFLEPFVDEICVVDNGSDDATVEIARRFKGRVRVHRTDRLDLAEVRNVGLEMATRPWILSLDPDEELAHWDLPRLVRLMDDLDVHAYSFEIANHQKDGPPVMTIAVRLFRNDARIRYGRAVHETVQPSLDRHPELVVRPSGVEIQHYGFLKDDGIMEEKLSRYLEANQRMREEDPADPMPWYNEGLHLLNDGRDDEAIAFLEKAMMLGQRFLSPRSSLAQIYQHRALALWQSMVAELPPGHPVRPTAEESAAALGRITPARMLVGQARRRRLQGPSHGD
ncbi:glycosyltransferase [Sorangium sp. So ce1000]|uniref:glycosyltransferase n=1 Tax=Sorangium sp. So ce1000 TaxID=3133325 RepID=UPI003F627BF8